MQYILGNIVAIAAATLVGLAILFLGFRSHLTRSTTAAAIPALFWLASILAGAMILAPVDAGPWTVTLGTAFIIWIGFVLPTLSIALTLRGNRWSTSLADAGWWLAIMLVQAVVLHGIGLTRPTPPPAVATATHG